MSATRVMQQLSLYVLASITASSAAMAQDDSTATFNTNVFSGVSTPALVTQNFSYLVLGICAAIFVVVMTMGIITLIRFRKRPGDDDREPPQIYGSNPLEMAWTVIPLITVLVLTLVTVRAISEIQIDQQPEGWMPVTATGHQWWWEFHYPEYGITTANELHVPVSNTQLRKPTFVTLESEDVIHSFWIPRLAGKTDVIPNRQNHMWINPLKTGLYVGQCSEYCGTQHANMLLRVYVHTPEEFQRWVEGQQRDAAEVAAVRKGRDIFLTTACINCHTVRGTVATGQFGPDLTHLMSRHTLGAGVAKINKANLHSWVLDPEHLKPGARMPAMKVKGEPLDQIVDYLMSLK